MIELGDALAARGRAVHEEQLIDILLGSLRVG